ncbi:MAG: trigger factor [Patescibacteria group bacterium]|nr:trigger factor [Patescibacteria group bacterium]
MKTKINKLTEAQIEIEIENSSEEFNGFIEQAVEKLGKDLEIKGFRKGNAPKEAIEREIGEETILTEASDLAIREDYRKAITENKIEPISQPKVEIKKIARGDSLIFTIKVDVFPEIELPSYKDIASNSTRKEITVEENEIKDTLSWLQKSRAKFILKNSPAEKGDFIEIEYSYSKNQGADSLGKNTENANLDEKKPIKDSFILGQGQFAPKFEEKLIGMTVSDEEKEFSISMPRNSTTNTTKESQDDKTQQSSPDFKGETEEVNFKVKVNSIQKVELAEIDDQFAKSLGKFEDLTGLKNSIKDGLNLEKKAAESQRIRKEILDNISKEVDCETPKALVEREQNEMMKNLKNNVSEKLRIPFEQYLNEIKKSEKEVTDSFLIEANERIKKFFILREIAKKEKIEILDEEIKEETEKLLKDVPNTDKAREGFDPENLKEYAKERIRNEKVFQLLEQSINKN